MSFPSCPAPVNEFPAAASPRRLAARARPFLAALSALLACHQTLAGTVTVDLAQTHQVIRGFGGATVFRPTEPLSDTDLDSLFGTGEGQIGLSILRIRVAPDDTWRVLELANARGAKARGALVMATPWSPPASMKDNNSLIDGSLKPSAYEAYATYLNDFARYMADHGAPLYAISVQNEPDIEVTYESCDWTAAQMLEFCRNYAGRITATRVIAPESFQFRHAMSDPILNDDIASANVDIIGGHIYGGGLTSYPLAEAKGKEVWMTEYLELTTDWAGALDTAREIHDCLATANFSTYLWWYLKRYYGPLGEDGVVTKRGYVMSQFSKFIRPGFVRVDASANPDAGVSVSAYKGDRLVIVAVNQGTAAATETFTVQGGRISSVAAWVTSGTANMEAQPAPIVDAGGFSATLPAESVTTFVAQLVVSAPEIATPPAGHRLQRGEPLVLEVAARGEALEYQWELDGVPLPGKTAAQLYLPAVAPSDAGAYTVKVGNSGGSVVSAEARIQVVDSANPGRLTNLSTRSLAGPGDSAQIGGFILRGTGARSVLVRASGPALHASYGLSGVLTDPGMDLHNASGAILASNQDWDAALAPTFASVGAFAWTTGSKDAALRLSLDPGAYTAVVRDTGGGTGLGLVEIFELPGGGSDSGLLNLSTRSLVGTGDNAQIAGFIISGETAKTVVIRASGPALARSFSVPGALADPTLELHAGTANAVVAMNDDWEPSLAPVFSAYSTFPWHPGTKDAALVATLDPGGYTAVVRGKNDGTGIALVEVYAK